MKKPIIFTDLDGTLLDHSSYSFEAALPALRLIAQRNIPLIICSSKTRKEIEHYRKKLNNLHPFVSENGGGVFIPKGYFKFQISNYKLQIEKDASFYIMRLGARYADLRKAIEELRAEGFPVKGFGDMSAEEISELTQLSLDEATMSKERDFDEPFVFAGGKEDIRRMLASVKNKGFTHTQGQFFHILGNSDKGKAVSILTDLFRREFGNITTIALGDSPNDVQMLENVDHPVIVRKRNGEYDKKINIPGLTKADGIGPDGWNSAVIKLIDRLTDNSPDTSTTF